MKTLIVTEGTKTEPQYFRGLVAHLRATATAVELAPAATVTGVGPGPMRALDRAVELREEERKKGKPYDQVWIVFDTDAHIGITETIEAAQREKIGVAITNPCFELWLLLHFEDVGYHCTSNMLSARLERHGIKADKAIPVNFRYSLHAHALGRISPGAESGQAPGNPGETISPLVRSLLP